MITSYKLSPTEALYLHQHDQQIFQKSAWNKTVWLSLCKLPNIYVLYGKETNTLYGFAIFLQVLEEVELLKWGVFSAWRTGGYGTQFFRHALQYLYDKRKVRTVFLECREDNEVAIHIYEKQGFEQVGLRKNYYSNPIAHARLYMYKYAQNVK